MTGYGFTSVSDWVEYRSSVAYRNLCSDLNSDPLIELATLQGVYDFEK